MKRALLAIGITLAAALAVRADTIVENQILEWNVYATMQADGPHVALHVKTGDQNGSPVRDLSFDPFPMMAPSNVAVAKQNLTGWYNLSYSYLGIPTPTPTASPTPTP